MKYIKTYEMRRESQKLTGYTGLLVLTIPSEVYFKSTTKFILQFVDEVFKNSNERQEVDYSVNGYAFERIETDRGDEHYSIKYESFTYSESEFKRFNFIKAEDFYKEYPNSFIMIMEIILDKLKEPRLLKDTIDVYNMILDRLTIPETEYLLAAKKYNL